ncbi:MAG TPA: hypothetical protein VKK79_22765 [Candidatus Lokiarchaeia archaeon]|nr:hypothetical protein [Candidatus Lokiarchaeia archaeon]
MVVLICLVGMPGLVNFVPFVGKADTEKIAGSPKVADVSGNEFYAEQITANVYGNTSDITQSMFTNDTDMFHTLDFNDPAFLNASLVIAASNGIQGTVNPGVYSPDATSLGSAFSSNAFFGFLYYNNKTSAYDVQTRSARAFRILQESFQLDLMRFNSTSSRFFPFIAYYPQWPVFDSVIFTNLPKDGYWGALDYSRIESAAYLASKPYSAVLVNIEKLGVLPDLENLAGNYYGINLNDILGATGFNLGSLNFNALTQQLGNNPFINASGIANVSSTVTSLTSVLSSTDFTTLLQQTRVLALTVQYEGAPAGIVHNQDGSYTFDLFKALNYGGTTLQPSMAIYIAIIGALLSSININLFSAEILDFAPQRCDFSESLIERIELLLFLTGQNIDLSTLQNYSFKTWFETTGGESTLYSTVYDPSNQQDYVNALYQLGFKGMPGIPLGVLNPLAPLWVQYIIPNSELVVDCRKTIDTGFNNVTGLSTMNVTVTNVGNRTVWGILPDRPIVTADQILGPIQTALPQLYDTLVNFAQNTLGQTMPQFLGMENAREFLVDTGGTGTYNYMYPDPTSAGALLPYNPLFATYLAVNEFNPNNPFGAAGLALIPFFNSSTSMFNPENYQLQPNQHFTYTFTNNTGTIVNSYTSFATYDYTTDTNFPAVAYGITADGTNPSLGQNLDNNTWNITSVQEGVQYLAQITFKFQNSSIPDPNKELNQLLLVYTGMSNVSLAGNIQWAVYNRTSGEGDAFQNFAWNTDATNPTTFTHTFNTNLNDYIDSSNNYTMYVRLTITNPAPFKLSIDDFVLNFTQLDTNALDLGSARVTYSTQSSYNRITVTSNNALLTTRDAPSLVAQADAKYVMTYPGQLNTYTLHISNNGTELAKSVNVSLTIPGIIVNPGNFTLVNNTLSCSLGDIANGTYLSNISFTFRTPNSELLPQAEVDYNNFKELGNAGPDFTVYSNQIFLTAPIDYITQVPYLNLISYAMGANASAPAVGSQVNITISIQNNGNQPILNLSLFWDQNLEGFHRLDNTSLQVNNLLPGATNAQNITITLNKTTYRGYFVPPMVAINGTESLTFRQTSESSLILGVMSLKITKTISQNQLNPGDVANITVTVQNNGTIEMDTLQLNDINSFPQDGYTLNWGVLTANIAQLAPGASITFSYSILAKTQGIFVLRGAGSPYFFIYKQDFTSAEVPTKIQEPWYIMILWIAVPLVISGFIMYAFFSMKKSQQKEDYELSRREELMFGKGGNQVAWEMKNLQQTLDEIREGGG